MFNLTTGRDMNGDFPFLHEDDEPERDDGIHRENDNLSPEQYLMDSVVGAYHMYLNAKGLDPDKHELHFSIEDEQTTLGKEMPTIEVANLLQDSAEFAKKIEGMLSDATTLAALAQMIRLQIKATRTPQTTKDMALEKLGALEEMIAGLVDHGTAATILAKELTTIINTSSAIETARIKVISAAKGNNNPNGDARHDGPIQ